MKATRTRYGVVGFAISLAVLSYIQRVAISQAAGPISHDLQLNKAQMGFASAPSAFPIRCSNFRPACSATAWAGSLVDLYLNPESGRRKRGTNLDGSRVEISAEDLEP